MPLLMTHGWPSCLRISVGFIPMLTDPARFGGDPKDAFTVVAPSMPGHGFSFKPNSDASAFSRSAIHWRS